MREIRQRTFTGQGQQIYFEGEYTRLLGWCTNPTFTPGHELVANMKILGDAFFANPQGPVLSRRYYLEGRYSQSGIRPPDAAELDEEAH